MGYQTSGYVFKAKQATSFNGAVLSTQVDLLNAGCATPAKLTWKYPKPFKLEGVTIDKLEMDKAGKFKLEASHNNVYPGLKVECKSDLEDINKVQVLTTYTGLKDAQIKVDCPVTKPQNFNAEATLSKGKVTCGLKTSSAILAGALPDVGLRFQDGALFCSVLAKEQLKTVSAHAFYKVNPDVNCAATYRGLYKVKFAQDQSVSCSYKHSFAKGFTVLSGLSYNVAKGSHSYGVQLSVE